MDEDGVARVRVRARARARANGPRESVGGDGKHATPRTLTRPSRSSVFTHTINLRVTGCAGFPS